MQVFMSKAQVNGIENYLTPEDIMLEYGSGGSTLQFSNWSKQYYSIEHEKEWYNKLVPETSKRQNIHYYFVSPNYGGEAYSKEIDPGNKLEEIFDEKVHGIWTIPKKRI